MGDAVGDHLGQLQALFIDVVEGDFAMGELGIGKNVTQKIAGEDGAAGADQRDFQGAETGVHECYPA